MATSVVVRARIDENIKKQAKIVLAEIGLTMSDAFRLLLTRIAKEKAMPYAPLIPNKETIKAMEDCDAGIGMITAGNTEELMRQLNADD